MPVPSMGQIKDDVTEFLRSKGGQAPTNDIHQFLENKWKLTPEELSQRDEAGGIHYKKHIDGAIAQLVKTGQIEHPNRGECKIIDQGISDKGNVGISDNKPAAVPACKEEVSPLSDYNIIQLLENQKSLFRAQFREKLMGLTPNQFEQFAGKLLEKLGFQGVQVTGRTGDGGIDGIGKLEMGIITVKAAFQVKRWQGNVPRPEIDKFRGAIQGQFDQGVFITSSDFSEDAKHASTRPGTVPVVMINGEKIIDIALQQNLGATIEPLTIPRLNEEFFNGLK